MELNREAKDGELVALISAAARYLAAGHELRELRPMSAVDRGLLPRDWINPDFANAKSTMVNGLLLAGDNHDAVTIGVKGPYKSLAPLASKYGSRANTVSYVSPDAPGEIVADPAHTDRPMLLVMSFDPAALWRQNADNERSRQPVVAAPPASLQTKIVSGDPD